MNKNKSLGKVFFTLLMPLSLIFALIIMFVIQKATGVEFYEISYDYTQFYVFSVPAILFFAGGIAIPKIWSKENKKQSIRLLAIPFLLNFVIAFGITAFEKLHYDLYIFNPYDYMNIITFYDIFDTEYEMLFPLVWLIIILFSTLCLVGAPILGALLFSKGKKAIKIPILLLITAGLIAVGANGICSYINDNIFYDVNGKEYSNPYDVVYYNNDGQGYKIQELKGYDFDHNACNIKVKSLDEKEEYYIGECYINEKTGLMIADPMGEIIIPLTDEQNVEMEQKSFDDDSYFQVYKGKDNNEYRQIANALYDKNGKLLKKYRFRINSTFYQLLKNANADADYYHYDLKGNRYVLGETIKYYDSKGNTYIYQSGNSLDYNSNYDVYSKNGDLIKTIDGWDYLVDTKTGFVVAKNEDFEYSVDDAYTKDKNGKNYQYLNETAYNKNGKVEKAPYLINGSYFDW